MNLIDALETTGIEFRQRGEHHHATEGWISLDCPECSPDSKKFLLGIHPDGYANCWKCGPKNAYRVIFALTGQKIAWNASRIDDLTPKGTLTLPTGIGDLKRIHVDYLRSRGFDPKKLERLWGIRGIGMAKRLSWRIWIPVVVNGKIVSWTTRSPNDKSDPRYVNAGKHEESVSLKKVLFGIDYIRHSAVIVEGPFDVFRIGPGAVATLGVGWTRTQLGLIGRIPIRYICYDNSVDAQARAARLCNELALFPGKTYRIQIDSADPGSAGKKEVGKIRKLLE